MMQTLVRAYEAPNRYTHRVGNTVDHLAVIDTIKRLDRLTPRKEYQYICYHIEQWQLGQPIQRSFWLNADMKHMMQPDWSYRER